MNKQEAIEKGYAALGIKLDLIKHLIDENGWVMMYKDDNKVGPSFREMGFSQEFYKDNLAIKSNQTFSRWWRPKELTGIENNRGWTKVDQDFTGVLENGYYEVLRPGFDRAYIREVFNDFDPVFWMNTYTHYKKVNFSELPVY